jgi:MATE family multidrug resistance protein
VRGDPYKKLHQSSFLIRILMNSGTPKLTVCPMSPVGPGVCSTSVSSPSSLWIHDMEISMDTISVSAAVKELVIMAVPNMLAFMASFAVNMITFAYLSVVDEPKLLGAVGLGSLIGNLFGFAIGIGLTGVLDTLVSQSVGAKNSELSIIHLNRARLISVVVTVPCFVLMWVTEPLLVLTRQDPETSALAGLFVQGTCWGLLPYFYCNAINSFMRCHGKTMPAVYINVGTSVFHAIISYFAIIRFGMGAYGAGICISGTYWLRWFLSELAMLIYPETRRALKWTPRALNWNGVVSYVTLACSNSTLLWIEWGAYELQALIAGWVGTEGLACHVASANVVTFVFMGAIGISQSAAALVGISLGKRRPNTAKSFAVTSMAFTALLYTFIGIFVILERHFITSIISTDPVVVETLHDLLIIVGVFAIVDAINGVGEGILRGMGLQQKAVLFKLVGMLAIRLPVGYILSVHYGVSGIWIGAIAGMMCSCSGFWYVIQRASFAECARIAISRQEEEKKNSANGLLEPLNRHRDSPVQEMAI